MAFTPFFFICLLSLFLTPTASQTPSSVVEADLIFPHNETYAPMKYFPLLWGLQNATTAYPYGFTLYWRLRLADSAIFVFEGDGRFPENQDWDDMYSHGPTPSDPIFFHDFPLKLRNFSTGHWELAWRFGFEYNCSLTDPGNPEKHSARQPWNSVIFAIDEGGKSVDLLADWDCEMEPRRAVAFEVSPPHRIESTQDCPVVNHTRPHPCALDFTAEAVENVTAAARALGRCEEFEGGLADFPVNCRNFGMRESIEWTGMLGVLGLVWVFVGLL
ncbi:uncharacterized protein DSM5745_00334 [Aspergillus mulundensis]|uniref:DUF7136 domain-containing protein n=1 Tax=Aspergillus mulundensis TaxID=1810919 RepID=A0A3D8T384_9EURO|nr:hypothetical protein DSM5745_00334 [Aspergillus mulundensis]RDW93012.1 hypothetical protein DSM5745_00334 [Aspergillus mulundensis]